MAEVRGLPEDTFTMVPTFVETGRNACKFSINDNPAYSKALLKTNRNNFFFRIARKNVENGCNFRVGLAT